MSYIYLWRRENSILRTCGSTNVTQKLDPHWALSSPSWTGVVDLAGGLGFFKLDFEEVRIDEGGPFALSGAFPLSTERDCCLELPGSLKFEEVIVKED